MRLWGRLRALISAKGSAKMSRMESRNTRELLDLNYQHQRTNLLRVRQGLQAVNTEKVGLERRLAELSERAELKTAQVEEALRMGRRDLAKEALAEKEAAVSSIAALREQLGGMIQRRDAMGATVAELETRLERTRQEGVDLLARKAAAEAVVTAQNSYAGVADSVSDATLQLERIRGEVKQLEHQADATSELVQLGYLDDSQGGDRVTRELERARGDSEVEAELDRISEQLQIAPAKDEKDKEKTGAARRGRGQS